MFDENFYKDLQKEEVEVLAGVFLSEEEHQGNVDFDTERDNNVY